MKTEIIAKIESLLQNEEVLTVQKEINELVSQYRNLTKVLALQQADPDHDEDGDEHQEEELQEPTADQHEAGGQPEESDQIAEPRQTLPESIVEAQDTPDPLDEKFAQIIAAFKTRVDEARRNLKKIEEETVATARHLLDELQNLVEHEENIGKAFSTFNAIQEKWKSLPKVSNEAYRELSHNYGKQIERFFYNINIYKELKDLDLKHNLEQKQLILEDQKKLLEVNDIRLLEVEVRLNQDRWNEVGPTFKEEWEKIKDEFWSITKSIYKRIHDFYQQRKEELDVNLEKKKELLLKVEQVITLQLKSTKKWQEKTEEVIDLQKQWKMIGPMPKEQGKEVARQFRLACDQFFKNKKSHFGEIKKVQDANKLIKEGLLEQALALKDSDEWAKTATAFKALQRQWTQTSAAHPRDENVLWRKFREACDYFFAKRDEYAAGESGRQTENLEKKKVLIESLKAISANGNREQALVEMKKLQEEWRNIGHVPMTEKNTVNSLFKEALDQKYGELKLDRKTRDKLKLVQKVESLKENDGGGRLLKKEKDHLKSKITKLQSDIALFENNMGFFSNSKGAEKLKQDVMKKIEQAKEELEALYDQFDIIKNA